MEMPLSEDDDDESMRNAPIGVSDFRKLRESDLLYVDKSPFIDQILRQSGVEVFLFTRPRRFGKTLNISMLNYYLNERFVGNKWFDDLEIARIRPNDPMKNSQIVIRLTFMFKFDGKYDTFMELAQMRVRECFSEHEYLLESEKVPTYLKNDMRKILYGSEELPSASLYKLSQMLYAHHGKTVVILIDEYDSPVNGSDGEEQRRILDFMSSFLSLALKDNDALRFSVLTGVMRIAKESIFSGLNNLFIDDVFSASSDEMFGFTSSDIISICNECDSPERYDEIREWYDGYRYGDTEIYNPWSVMNYVGKGFKAGIYWGMTSGNDVIDRLLSKGDSSVVENLTAFGEGRSVEMELDDSITYRDLVSTDRSLYSIMVMTGYLRATPAETDGRYLVSIPNKEMMKVFSKHILDRVHEQSGLDASSFRSAVLSGDPDKMMEVLTRFSMETISVRLSKDHTAYQMFISGLMMDLQGSYDITTDFESGSGFHDLRMRRVKGKGPNIIIEFKDTSNGDPEKISNDALLQIHRKQYYYGMTGRVFLYGVCIKEKVPTIVFEELDLR